MSNKQRVKCGWLSSLVVWFGCDIGVRAVFMHWHMRNCVTSELSWFKRLSAGYCWIYSTSFRFKFGRNRFAKEIFFWIWQKNGEFEMYATIFVKYKLEYVKIRQVCTWSIYFKKLYKWDAIDVLVWVAAAWQKLTRAIAPHW